MSRVTGCLRKAANQYARSSAETRPDSMMKPFRLKVRHLNDNSLLPIDSPVVVRRVGSTIDKHRRPGRATLFRTHRSIERPKLTSGRKMARMVKGDFTAQARRNLRIRENTDPVAVILATASFRLGLTFSLATEHLIAGGPRRTLSPAPRRATPLYISVDTVPLGYAWAWVCPFHFRYWSLEPRRPDCQQRIACRPSPAG